MKNIKIKAAVISWLVFWGIDTHAETSSDIFYKHESYKELLNTKNIVGLQFSEDKRHFLLIYATPQVYESKQGMYSQWQAITLVKNDYKSEKSHTVKFPDDRGFNLITWIPSSQNISYLGKGDKYTSLWVTPCHEFKPKKILEFSQNIKHYCWSPDGKKLAFLVYSFPPSSSFKTLYGENRMALATLYVMEVDKKGQLVDNASFSFDLKNTYSITWFPGNEKVIFSYNSQEENEASLISQIVSLDLKTKEKKVLLKEEEISLLINISPDGKWLAYNTRNFPGRNKNPIPLYQIDASRTCLIDLQNGQKRCLAPTPNENPELVGWKKDGKSVFVIDREGKSDQIYELNLEGTKATKFTQGEKSLRAVQLNTGDTISYSAQDFKTPAEAYVTSVDHFHPEKITSLSTPNLPSHLSIEKVKWKSKDKKFDLEGIVIYPNTPQEKTLFPLITLLKDYNVPSTSLYLGNLSSYPISYLRLLRQGYALFIPTRRGENGYGVQFRQAIYKELGKGDFEDIMAGIEAVIEGKKADPTKLALWGWGYGGYLSAWALSQTARFKTIIVGQGIVNLISSVGTTTKPEFLEAVMGGPFWKDLKLWDERSPISYVKNMNTPTLLQYIDPGKVIQKSQGEELYFPLKTRNIPSDMYRYESSGDDIFDSQVTLFGIQELENWLEKYFEVPSNIKVEK